jgi:hypothetical protein
MRSRGGAVGRIARTVQLHNRAAVGMSQLAELFEQPTRQCQ